MLILREFQLTPHRFVVFHLKPRREIRKHDLFASQSNTLAPISE